MLVCGGVAQPICYRFSIVQMATYMLPAAVLLAMVVLISAAPIEEVRHGEELGDGETKDLLMQSLQLLASSKKEGVVKRDINTSKFSCLSCCEASEILHSV